MSNRILQLLDRAATLDRKDPAIAIKKFIELGVRLL